MAVLCLAATAPSLLPPTPLPPPLCLHHTRPARAARMCDSRDAPADDLAAPDAKLRLELAALQRKNEARGWAAWLVVLSISVWFFSVPPAIRRANVCPPQLTEERQGQCMPIGALAEQVVEHYRTCGGAEGAPCVDFDFSVDPKSRAAFSELVQQVRAELHVE
ncbi:hypothetical protein AB1Y20_011765 [Prymnesium parvum]|uniref:Uncharacterized protein n=1 Tax=Prymnesium parvum TaxID=97485 RepID=A0AB34IHH4_PRYPA